MSRRVQFDRYGPADVLQVADVPRPQAGEGQILVQVVAAGINPGEIAIRNGALEAMFPAAFPSGQGSDFAGRVVETGQGVTEFAPGDEVLGWSDSRSAQADYVLSDPRHLTTRPAALDWIRAGSLWAVGVTSFSAVRAVGIRAGEVVAVSGAAGGVGRLAAQLARHAGARVLGIASAASAERLQAIGVELVAYGDGLASRIRELAPGGIDAFVDAHGDGYVDLAAALGVAPDRIDTIIDFDAAQRHGAKTDASPQGSNRVLAIMAGHVAWGRLTMPIAAIYPLEQVRAAYTELASGHVYGKIVLSTEMPADAQPLRAAEEPSWTGTSEAADRNSGVIAEFRASHGRVGGYFAEATDTAAIPVRLKTCARTDLIGRIMPCRTRRYARGWANNQGAFQPQIIGDRERRLANGLRPVGCTGGHLV